MPTQRSRTRRWALLAAVPLVAMSACGDDDESGDEAETAMAAIDAELDLDTMVLEVEQGDIDVEARANPHVGEVTDDLFIGFTFPDGAAPGNQVAVYLCDGDDGEWLSGEIGADGTATLEGERTLIELELTDEGVTGTATWGDDSDPMPFTAEPVDGDAGLYTAGESFDDVNYSAGWVVLPDGRQRGFIPMCPPMPLHVCWMQRM